MIRRSMLHLLALLAVFAMLAAACGDDDATTGDSSGEGTAADGDTGGDATTTTAAAVDETTTTAAEDAGYTVRAVPADYGTIQEAVDAAEPGDLVLIDEGVYHEAVVVQTDDLVIRGVDRNGVILDGEFADGFENGVIVFSDGVAIENLTVRNYSGNGLFWTGDYDSDIFVDGYRASYVTTHNIGVYGIYAFNAVNGQIDNSYAASSDDSSFYVGQCDPCNALLYNVVGTNSQLGYSGTNSTGTTIVASEFYDNMIGVVPNSMDGEELAPNAGTTVVGNYIHDNNKREVPSRNSGFRTGIGTGVILAGVTDNIVERNLIVDNERAGVIILDWVASILGGETDYPAMNNIVRDNVISGSTLDADLLLAIVDTAGGGQGNCFSGNTFGSSTPADAETVLPCDGESSGEGLLPLEQLIDRFSLEDFEVPSYQDMPAPELNFDNMPGDPATEPPAPAIDVPMAIDLDSFGVPEPG